MTIENRELSAVFEPEIASFLAEHYGAITPEKITNRVASQVEKALLEEPDVGNEPRILKLIAKLNPALSQKLQRELQSLLLLLKSPALDENLKKRLAPQVRQILQDRVGELHAEIFFGEFLLSNPPNFFDSLQLAIPEYIDSQCAKLSETAVQNADKILSVVDRLNELITSMVRELKQFLAQYFVGKHGNKLIHLDYSMEGWSTDEPEDPSDKGVEELDGSWFEKDRIELYLRCIKSCESAWDAVLGNHEVRDVLFKNPEKYDEELRHFIACDVMNKYPEAKDFLPSEQARRRNNTARKEKQQEAFNEFKTFLQATGRQFDMAIFAEPDALSPHTAGSLHIEHPGGPKQPLTPEERISLYSNDAIPRELRLLAVADVDIYRTVVKEAGAIFTVVNSQSCTDEALKQDLQAEVKEVIKKRLKNTHVQRIYVAMHMISHWEEYAHVVLAAVEVIKDSIDNAYKKGGEITNGKVAGMCNLIVSLEQLAPVLNQWRVREIPEYIGLYFLHTALEQGVIQESDLDNVVVAFNIIRGPFTIECAAKLERFIMQERIRLGLNPDIHVRIL